MLSSSIMNRQILINVNTFYLDDNKFNKNKNNYLFAFKIVEKKHPIKSVGIMDNRYLLATLRLAILT